MISVAAGSLRCREDSPPPSGWYVTVVVLKQLGAGPELVHRHATQTLEAFMASAVTPVGVGGAGVVQRYKQVNKQLVSSIHTYIYLLLGEQPFLENSCY